MIRIFYFLQELRSHSLQTKIGGRHRYRYLLFIVIVIVMRVKLARKSLFRKTLMRASGL